MNQARKKRSKLERLVAEFKWDVLAHAVFEGEQGIAEPLWEANGRFEHLTKQEREDLTEMVLQELLDAEMIVMYRASLDDETPAKSEIKPFGREEAERTLKASWWRQYPLADADVWFTSTPKGDRVCKRRIQKRGL